MSVQDAKTLAQIDIGACFNISYRKKGLEDYFQEHMQKEMNQYPITIQGLDLQKPNNKKKCIDLQFFLDNSEDLDYIKNQPNPSTYLSYLFNYFELGRIQNFLEELNLYQNLVSVMDIKASGVYTKIFLRGKPLNDLGRAMVITEDGSLFISKLNSFIAGSDFDYWVEDDRNNEVYRTVKVYLYHKTKNYKGRILSYEIQLTTPKIYFFGGEADFHSIYEAYRYNSYKACKETYKKNGINNEDFITQLCNTSSKILNLKEFKDFCTQGLFEESGNNIILKRATHPNDPIIFKDCYGASENGLKVINGNLQIFNSSYYWSENNFPTNKNYTLKGELHLSPETGGFCMGIGPRAEYHGQDSNKSYTFCIMRQAVWLRSECWNQQEFYDNIYDFPVKQYFPFEVKIHQRKISCTINGIPIDNIYQYNHDTFKLGFLTFDKQKECYVRNLQLVEN